MTLDSYAQYLVLLRDWSLFILWEGGSEVSGRVTIKLTRSPQELCSKYSSDFPLPPPPPPPIGGQFPIVPLYSLLAMTNPPPVPRKPCDPLQKNHPISPDSSNFSIFFCGELSFRIVANPQLDSHKYKTRV